MFLIVLAVDRRRSWLVLHPKAFQVSKIVSITHYPRLNKLILHPICGVEARPAWAALAESTNIDDSSSEIAMMT